MVIVETRLQAGRAGLEPRLYVNTNGLRVKSIELALARLSREAPSLRYIR
jgi:hypothetical protein